MKYDRQRSGLISARRELVTPIGHRRDGSPIWPIAGKNPAIPIPQAVGTTTVGAGAISVPWPTHLADDIGVLVTEYDTNGGTPPASVTGFTQFPFSPFGTGTAPTSSTGLSVWWRRATGASESNGEVGDCGNHAVGRIVTLRGCIATGDPYNVISSTQTDDTEDTSQSILGTTTTVAECLILILCANGANFATNSWSNLTNADLANLTNWASDHDTIINGGGFLIAYGEKASAGTYGTTTVTSQRTSAEASVSIAFKPPEPPSTTEQSFAVVAGV